VSTGCSRDDNGNAQITSCPNNSTFYCCGPSNTSCCGTSTAIFIPEVNSPLSTTTSSTTSSTSTRTSAQTSPAVSTSSNPMPTSESGLSRGGRAGVGVGIGAAAIVGLLFLGFYFMKKSADRKSSSYPFLETEMAQEKKGNSRAEPHSYSVPGELSVVHGITYGELPAE